MRGLQLYFRQPSVNQKRLLLKLSTITDKHALPTQIYALQTKKYSTLQTKENGVRAQADAKNQNQLIRIFGANFDILNMVFSQSDFSDVEANAEVDDGEGIVNEGLPSGSERDVLLNIISIEVLRTGK